MQMKASEFIAKIVSGYIDTVFSVIGGGCIHLSKAFAENPKLRMVYCHHEQACTFAAEGYARVHGIGCALVTTGPGSTNAISGVAGAWFDSIPMVVISGQWSQDSFRNMSPHLPEDQIKEWVFK
jgi:acetolactate synthase-1/2/3 large subunit